MTKNKTKNRAERRGPHEDLSLCLLGLRRSKDCPRQLVFRSQRALPSRLCLGLIVDQLDREHISSSNTNDEKGANVFARYDLNCHAALGEGGR